jgi:hypothetical protein
MNRFCGIVCPCILLFCVLPLWGQDNVQHVVGSSNNEIRVVNTYPEYWVDGKPFIMHSAAFFYHRLPRDRWAEELEHLKAMGVNTIDVYPFWNWHEPEEDALDFDGHTNPRRDLKYLLQLLQEMNFKVTFRPGPYFTAEWRNGGYPGWLLHRPEYGMSQQAILENRYPRLSALQYDRSEEAAIGYLSNATHLRYARKWYQDVLSVAEPYLAERGGNIINIQIDDDQAIGQENYNGPNFWKYMNLLRSDAQEATHHSNIPYYINGSDMRLNAEGNSLQEPFWNMGQDYQMSGAAGYSSLGEAAKNKFNTDALKTQPLFPAAIIEYGPGWRLSEKDTFETPSHDPTNLLLRSRVMFQNGMKVLNYYSLDDTLYPAGYETPWANYFYAREGAIDYTGKERLAWASYARRNGRLFEGMGALIGASHPLADAALFYTMGTFPQRELTGDEAGYVAAEAKRITWSSAFEHYNFELVDSELTPPKNFQRYKLVLFFDPAAGEEELGKPLPHLHQYSERAQSNLKEYLEAGGAVLLFPSIPKGKIFDQIFARLGSGRTIQGDAEIRFSDGARGEILGARTVLSPQASDSQLTIFARDSNGNVLGAEYSFGGGRVIFFGGDFSRWSTARRGENSDEGVGQLKPLDYSQEKQRNARILISALMRQAGIMRKIDGCNEDAGLSSDLAAARDMVMYATELVADSGSLSFDRRRSNADPGYSFVGVTNFNAERSYSCRLSVTDPLAPDLGSNSSSRSIRLPVLTLPARESLMLPIRIPLNSRLLGAGSQLDASDEVYYATAELTHVAYDGKSLALELTAPADAELALRLSKRPESVAIDGIATNLREAQGLFFIRVPGGKAPDFLRRVELMYPRRVAAVGFTAGKSWLAGQVNTAIVRVDNFGALAVQGTLEFSAPGFQEFQKIPVNVGANSKRQFSFMVKAPTETAEGITVELQATLRSQDSEIARTICHVIVHHPWTATVEATSAVFFPLREDQAVPIIHPILASVNLPGAASLQVRVRNWSAQEQSVTVKSASLGQGITITPSSFELTIPANRERTVELRAQPEQGTGLYQFTINLDAQNASVSEQVMMAAVGKGEALAYKFDYDRDNFDDVILENQNIRCFLSPHAGGRSFAFARKETNNNVFDSVGGMRDSFTTRFEPPDMHSLPHWTNDKWLGLYNRPYSSQIAIQSGRQAEVHLEYEAPDIYPKGIKLERTLTLDGNMDDLTESTSVTPLGIEKPQALVLENSVPFRVFLEPNYKSWFTEDQQPREFTPHSKIELPAAARVFGTVNQKTAETFSVTFLTAPQAIELLTEVHSALLRVIYPEFLEANKTYTYDLRYHLGKKYEASNKDKARTRSDEKEGRLRVQIPNF